MSHAVAEPPHKSGGHHGHADHHHTHSGGHHGHTSHGHTGGHTGGHSERMRIFDHLPVHQVPEGFTAPEPIVHDPHADHHHHHEDHSEQNQQIKEILGDSPDMIAYRKFEAALERLAAPVWSMLGTLGINVY